MIINAVASVKFIVIFIIDIIVIAIAISVPATKVNANVIAFIACIKTINTIIVVNNIFLIHHYCCYLLPSTTPLIAQSDQ